MINLYNTGSLSRKLGREITQNEGFQALQEVWQLEDFADTTWLELLSYFTFADNWELAVLNLVDAEGKLTLPRGASKSIDSAIRLLVKNNLLGASPSDSYWLLTSVTPTKEPQPVVETKEVESEAQPTQQGYLLKLFAKVDGSLRLLDSFLVADYCQQQFIEPLFSQGVLRTEIYSARYNTSMSQDHMNKVIAKYRLNTPVIVIGEIEIAVNW